MKTSIASLLFVFTIQINFAQTGNFLSKKRIIQIYDSLYKTSKVDSIVWNGDVKSCKCGSLSSNIYKKAENRINFFRIVVGLPTVKLNQKLNEAAQAAALLSKANNYLTHTPAKSSKCYSSLAYDGCHKSCLAISDFKFYPKTAFVTGFIDDFGSDNYFVGHRKWLLYSKLKEFGYGATNSSEAILTVDGVTFDSLPYPEYVAYPWNGFVPVDLIFPKWSFSLHENLEVDFSNATIAMTDNKGKTIQIERLKEYKNYLDHTIVWTAKGLFTDSEIQYLENNLEKNGFLDKVIKVSIKNVKVNGILKNFDYNVTPIKIV